VQLEKNMIDVRSPAEFAQGHIPGAINIPLFTDAERAEVGTLYKQVGRDAAVMRGLEIVGPKMTHIVQAAREATQQSISTEKTLDVSTHEKTLDVSTREENIIAQKPMVYCWRGGMRSASVAWLLRTAGIDCDVLPGGYKTYRKWVLGGLSGPWKMVVVGGRTGSGKSKILQELHKRGHQVLDLEDICNHKGSAFGWLSQPPQPSAEQAVNMMHATLQTFDSSKLIFVEDESRMVGRIALPPELFQAMKESPVVVVEIPRSARAEYLGDDYGEASHEELQECFVRIAKKLGGDRLATATQAVAENRLADAADVALDYYDRTYDHGLREGKKKIIHTIQSPLHDPQKITDEIEALILSDPDSFEVNFS